MCVVQMVSCESISTGVKFKENASFFFNKPMAFAGNSLWMSEQSDNAKQLTRRLLLLAFTVEVSEQDTNIKFLLREQMPALIVKCARAFQTFLVYKGNRGELHTTPTSMPCHSMHGPHSACTPSSCTLS